MLKITAFAAALLITLSTALTAQAQPMPPDAPGGMDHPLLKRYAGSWLIGWRTSNFAEVKPLHMLTEDIAILKNDEIKKKSLGVVLMRGT